MTWRLTLGQTHSKVAPPVDWVRWSRCPMFCVSSETGLAGRRRSASGHPVTFPTSWGAGCGESVVRPALDGHSSGGTMSSFHPVARLRSAAALSAAAAVIGAVALAHPADSATGSSDSLQQVIFSGSQGSLNSVEHAVTAAGGHVSKVLHVINGVAAELPA